MSKINSLAALSGVGVGMMSGSVITLLYTHHGPLLVGLCTFIVAMLLHSRHTNN